MSKRIIRLILISLPILVLLSALFAHMSSNTVSESGISFTTEEVTANQLKPSACAGLNLTAYYYGIDGSDTNDLVLGASIADSLNGGDGDDCVVGGSGDDSLDGGAGTDICIGGEGTNTFSNCETQINP